MTLPRQNRLAPGYSRPRGGGRRRTSARSRRTPRRTVPGSHATCQCSSRARSPGSTPRSSSGSTCRAGLPQGSRARTTTAQSATLSPTPTNFVSDSRASSYGRFAASRIRLTRCDHLCGPLHVGSAVPEREVAKLRLGPRRELARRRKCVVLLTVDRYGVAVRLPQTALHPVNPRDAHLCRANERYQTRKTRVACEAHPLVRIVRSLEEGKIRGCIENRIEVVVEPE